MSELIYGTISGERRVIGTKDSTGYKCVTCNSRYHSIEAIMDCASDHKKRFIKDVE